MTTLAARFEEKVDRSGEHHLWRGSKKTDGTGKLKVDGKTVTAARVAWELAHGPLPHGIEVRACAAEKACVRVEHLSVGGTASPPNIKARASAPRGGGSKREVRPGVWKFTVTAGRYDDGSVRRAHSTVHARTEREATKLLAAFVAEVSANQLALSKGDRDLTVDAAVELFLTEHLLGERGRDERTAGDYRSLHAKWFSPHVGARRLRDIDEAAIDRLFGRMRRAGLSRSRLNQAKSLYAPLFRWAKRRRFINRNPMAEFELPTSRYVSKERVPPEVEQLCLLLETAVEIVPDVAPALALGAVTGMRRGELAGLRRTRIDHDELRVTVDAAVSTGSRVKSTKTRRERSFYLDPDTMAMLDRHCLEMDERAATVGVDVPRDAFVFSLAPDCSTPMPPDYLTKRVAVLKEHLGIADKRPETIELEDEALALYRSAPSSRPTGRTGPAPKGSMSLAAIGQLLGRSEKWAALAVASAQRREAAARTQPIQFDGSILALRKFTSSELLDAGFNISMVAQRQGHGPQVLVKHYAKARRSSDKKAAEHLGRVIHGGR